MSISSTGGSLHGNVLKLFTTCLLQVLLGHWEYLGTWSSESIISASDERLKSKTQIDQNILRLLQALSVF